MNKNTLAYLLLAWLISATYQSCTDDMADAPYNDACNCINLDVSVPLASSRAEADDKLNEFKVRRLHLFFFKADNHDDATSEYVYDVTVNEEFDFSRQLRMALPDDALDENGLFGRSATSCHVYAVANIDENSLTGKTVNELKSSAVSSGFEKTVIQDSFAMDGYATLELDRTTRTVSGKIELRRAAAKLTLSVDLPESIDVEQTIVNPFDGTTQTVTTTYFSRAADMRVWIANGVKESMLNADPEPVSEEYLYSNEIYSAPGVGSPFTFDGSQPKYSYQQDVPFYSYPAQWDSYSPRGNCYLTMEIPWYYADASGTIQNIVTYYRLSVQPGTNRIERNTHYDMRVTVGRLGGTVVQQPVDMLFDWNYNMEWNVQTLPTDIKEIRYLLLNNNDFSPELDAYSYTMDNETEISIPFNTSHPVEIESVNLIWHDFRNNLDRERSLTYGSGSYQYSDIAGYSRLSDFAGIEIDAVNSALNLKRDILHIAWSNNRPVIRDENAINAYTFEIKLRHTDAPAGYPSSHATVVITQIPAIYITTQLTASGTRFINNQNTSYGSNSNPRGYVSTSDVWSSLSTTRRRFWLGSYHNGDNYVQNKHTYVLTISKFAAGDDYIIADPRSRQVDNLNESSLSATATASWSIADNTQSRLNNYYPADRNSAKIRFIAPKLRVASQWGVTYQISNIAAERRCASYQEDGRPAGRWRLPTAAEIEYISRLSNKQYIPYLFGTEGGTAQYWCASGGINVDNDTDNPSVEIVTTTSGERRAVRCVYDEWFWGADTLVNKRNFHWGDRARTVNGN